MTDVAPLMDGTGRARHVARARLAMRSTAAWAVAYVLAAVFLPFDLPDRTLIMNVAYVPSHALAAWALWHVARASVDDARRAAGLMAFFTGQALGVLNSGFWVLNALGLVGPLSMWFQLLAIGMVVCSLYGISELVPVRRDGATGVPWLDGVLLLLASVSIGWYSVGWPLLSSGLESAESFAWFAIIASADSFVALLAMMAWVYPSPRLTRSAAATLAASQLYAAWGDVALETGLATGSYTSGEPLDAVFAISIFLLVLAGWRAIAPVPVAAPEEGPSERPSAGWQRLLVPGLASAAVALPVILSSWRDAHGTGLIIPVVLLVAFVVVLQWRHEQLERARARVLERRFALERDLALNRQFAAIGRFAGQIAHDFNNVLSGIVSYVELLKMGFVQPSEMPQVLEIMEQSAQRGVTLNRRLQGILRGHEAPPQPTELAALVRSVADSLRRVMPPDVELVLSLPRTPVLVDLPPGDGDQVVLNLLVNARDAMPQGGRVTATVRVEGDVAVLEVEDTGTGIPQALRERIFEPLFTTKDAGRGTGLGLATVRGVVDAADGSIAVWSEEGRGTRFTIRFPLSRLPAD